MKKLLSCFCILVLFSQCSSEPKQKGFSVHTESPEESGETEEQKGLNSDSLNLDTRPGGVLISGYPQFRLIPIYLLNAEAYRGKLKYFSGSNAFHHSYGTIGRNDSNNWHSNYMPGFTAMYGYNLLNMQLHDVHTKGSHAFFENPVLIKTVYFPAFSKDTLNGRAVKRDYYMVSAYNEDSNQDQYINSSDLRRFFRFDLHGKSLGPLIPLNYSVRSSQYDPANDYMYVYAAEDEDNNGRIEAKEKVKVFWIDLNNPKLRGLMF